VWDSDNKHLYSASEQGLVKRWDTTAGSETASLDCGSPLSVLTFDPRKKQLAIGLQNGVVRLVSAEKLELLSEWQNRICPGQGWRQSFRRLARCRDRCRRSAGESCTGRQADCPETCSASYARGNASQRNATAETRGTA
jgi:hypothetical protein